MEDLRFMCSLFIFGSLITSIVIRPQMGINKYSMLVEWLYDLSCFYLFVGWFIFVTGDGKSTLCPLGSTVCSTPYTLPLPFCHFPEFEFQVHRFWSPIARPPLLDQSKQFSAVCFHRPAGRWTHYQIIVYMYGWKKDLTDSRKECLTFPKQFSLLFSNIFKVEVLTTATMFLKTIIEHDSA